MACPARTGSPLHKVFTHRTQCGATSPAKRLSHRLSGHVKRSVCNNPAIEGAETDSNPLTHEVRSGGRGRPLPVQADSAALLRKLRAYGITLSRSRKNRRLSGAYPLRRTAGRARRSPSRSGTAPAGLRRELLLLSIIRRENSCSYVSVPVPPCGWESWNPLPLSSGFRVRS